MATTDPKAELDARFSAPDAVPTPWAETARVIADAELFWIATVRADKSPHVTPLPAVWHDGALHFCTGAGEQKGVDLRRDPHCTLTTGTNRWNEGLDVVVEGAAVRVTDESRLQRLATRRRPSSMATGTSTSPTTRSRVGAARPWCSKWFRARSSRLPRATSPRRATASAFDRL
jgi:nitroimidazol reductase NimA-like FMN-containing flavoprotein (pyridoxamine 5'-phosphate oxidase superfamily)